MFLSSFYREAGSAARHNLPARGKMTLADVEANEENDVMKLVGMRCSALWLVHREKVSTTHGRS